MRPISLPRGVVPVSIAGTLVGGAVLLHDKLTKSGVKYKGEEQLTGRTVVITGASSGIGETTAKELARRGGRIIMGCRDMEKCEKVKKEIIEASFNKNVHCRQLDLASLKSVREFAENIKENEKRLDLLINNAGIMGIREREVTQDGFEMHLGVNYLGHFLLTHLLLDKLKSSAPSRIIHLTSAIYKRGNINFDDLNKSKAKGYMHDSAYAQSKLAVVMFNRKLASLLEGSKVTTYVVYPGVVKTNFGRNLSMNQATISGPMTGGALRILMKTPEEGIQTVLHCALNPDLAEESGQYYATCAPEPVDDQAKDQKAIDRLDAISRVWTGLGLT